MTEHIHPILYSFRRCPYAMRARLALHYAQIKCEHREIILRDKPTHMLEISPKGTVPVLLLPSGKVIDESLDIMMWALSQNDPDTWQGTPEQKNDIDTLIKRNDTTFKHALDRYKYPSRYPDEKNTGTKARDSVQNILQDLNERIAKNSHLSGEKQTLADAAIFPFIRQFAHVDKEWFFAQPYPHLQGWLEENLLSERFLHIMKKHNQWLADSQKTYNI